MIAGRYGLEREVGRGGMGAVWLARDEVLGRAVAIKRLGMDTGAGTGGAAAAAGGSVGDLDLVRAEREARLAAMLNHPHVVAVYDLVVEDHQQWLVMEYVPSLTLAELVHRDGPLGAERTAALLAQAADALAVAHRAGIVHRDVKPSNMLVTADDRVKITDFGIARAQADASLTATGLVTGSPAYLAPEVASGRPATPASDVWSLGATLFHALGGRPPYDVGDNVVGALYRIVHEDPPRLAPERAGWLAPVLEATMAADPDERWTADRVRDVLAGGPATLPGDVGSRRPAPLSAATAAPVPPPVVPEDGVTAVVRPPLQHDGDAQGGGQGDGNADRPRRAVPALAVVAAALALVVALALIVALLADREDAPPAADPTPAGQGGAAAPSASPSATPTPTPPPAPEVTAQQMEEFVEDYLDDVTEDPGATFERLTPAFQRASGGFDSYAGFWSTVRDARARDVVADPGAMTVSYTADYRMVGGGRTTDRVQLRLRAVDGELLVAGES